MNDFPEAFACINKDNITRNSSSSGGIFTLLANEILEKNGVVFGVAFDEEYNIIHTYAENQKDCEKFRGSKYAQSKMGDSLKKAKEFLDDGRYVLFTGTPCQIEGLKRYLNKEYENLYAQDIICHGVPPHKVWEKYLEYRKEQSMQIPEKISFRNKNEGWRKFSMEFEYKNGQNYIKTLEQDPYMQDFLRNTSLRESCYNCQFKKKHRISDITLADFWGIENVAPEMDDDKGTSLVIINSEKGKKIFEQIKDKINYKQVDFEEAIRYNPSMTTSVKPDPNREKFFENLDKMPFDELVKKYTYTPSIFKRILWKVKRVVKKIIKK